MSEQAIKWVTGTSSASGDVPMVAAVADNSIGVAFLLAQNTSATADTFIIKEGSAAKITALAQNQGDGVIISLPSDAYVWKLPANTALNLNKAQAVACTFTVGYYLESV